MSTTSDLTIIIPAKNEAILLPRLLNSLAAGLLGDAEYEGVYS